jgi:hypothetical protein
MNRRLAYLRWLQPGAVRQLHRYYQDAMTPCRHPAALRFLRLAVPQLHSLVRSLTESAPPRPGVGNPVSPSREFAEERTGFSQVPGEPRLSVCTCSHPTPAGLRAPDRYGAAAWPLNALVQRLSRLGLSTLNSMAFGLAVYASQCGLLPHHARLASSCWSDSTGRAFHPHGSAERFQSCGLHLILLSQACLAQRAPPKHFSMLPILASVVSRVEMWRGGLG